jgi:hypothetical protein
MDKTMTFIYFPRVNLEHGQDVEQRIRDFRESGVRILDETSIEKSDLSMVIFRYEEHLA